MNLRGAGSNYTASTTETGSVLAADAVKNQIYKLAKEILIPVDISIDGNKNVINKIIFEIQTAINNKKLESKDINSTLIKLEPLLPDKNDRIDFVKCCVYLAQGEYFFSKTPANGQDFVTDLTDECEKLDQLVYAYNRNSLDSLLGDQYKELFPSTFFGSSSSSSAAGLAATSIKSKSPVTFKCRITYPRETLTVLFKEKSIAKAAYGKHAETLNIQDRTIEIYGLITALSDALKQMGDNDKNISLSGDANITIADKTESIGRSQNQFIIAEFDPQAIKLLLTTQVENYDKFGCFSFLDESMLTSILKLKEWMKSDNINSAKCHILIFLGADNVNSETTIDQKNAHNSIIGYVYNYISKDTKNSIHIVNGPSKVIIPSNMDMPFRSKVIEGVISCLRYLNDKQYQKTPINLKLSGINLGGLVAIAVYDILEWWLSGESASPQTNVVKAELWAEVLKQRSLGVKIELLEPNLKDKLINYSLLLLNPRRGMVQLSLNVHNLVAPKNNRQLFVIFINSARESSDAFNISHITVAPTIPTVVISEAVSLTTAEGKDIQSTNLLTSKVIYKFFNITSINKEQELELLQQRTKLLQLHDKNTTFKRLLLHNIYGIKNKYNDYLLFELFFTEIHNIYDFDNLAGEFAKSNKMFKILFSEIIKKLLAPQSRIEPAEQKLIDQFYIEHCPNVFLCLKSLFNLYEPKRCIDIINYCRAKQANYPEINAGELFQRITGYVDEYDLKKTLQKNGLDNLIIDKLLWFGLSALSDEEVTSLYNTLPNMKEVTNLKNKTVQELTQRGLIGDLQQVEQASVSGRVQDNGLNSLRCSHFIIDMLNTVTDKDGVSVFANLNDLAINYAKENKKFRIINPKINLGRLDSTFQDAMLVVREFYFLHNQELIEEFSLIIDRYDITVLYNIITSYLQNFRGEELEMMTHLIHYITTIYYITNLNKIKLELNQHTSLGQNMIDDAIKYGGIALTDDQLGLIINTLDKIKRDGTDPQLVLQQDMLNIFKQVRGKRHNYALLSQDKLSVINNLLASIKVGWGQIKNHSLFHRGNLKNFLNVTLPEHDDGEIVKSEYKQIFEYKHFNKENDKEKFDNLPDKCKFSDILNLMNNPYDKNIQDLHQQYADLFFTLLGYQTDKVQIKQLQALLHNDISLITIYKYFNSRDLLNDNESVQILQIDLNKQKVTYNILDTIFLYVPKEEFTQALKEIQDVILEIEKLRSGRRAGQGKIYIDSLESINLDKGHAVIAESISNSIENTAINSLRQIQTKFFPLLNYLRYCAILDDHISNLNSQVKTLKSLNVRDKTYPAKFNLFKNSINLLRSVNKFDNEYVVGNSDEFKGDLLHYYLDNESNILSRNDSNQLCKDQIKGQSDILRTQGYKAAYEKLTEGQKRRYALYQQHMAKYSALLHNNDLELLYNYTNKLIEACNKAKTQSDIETILQKLLTEGSKFNQLKKILDDQLKQIQTQYEYKIVENKSHVPDNYCKDPISYIREGILNKNPAIYTLFDLFFWKATNGGLYILGDSDGSIGREFLLLIVKGILHLPDSSLDLLVDILKLELEAHDLSLFQKNETVSSYSKQIINTAYFIKGNAQEIVLIGDRTHDRFSNNKKIMVGVLTDVYRELGVIDIRGNHDFPEGNKVLGGVQGGDNAIVQAGDNDFILEGRKFIRNCYFDKTSKHFFIHNGLSNCLSMKELYAITYDRANFAKNKDPKIFNSQFPEEIINGAIEYLSRSQVRKAPYRLISFDEEGKKDELSPGSIDIHRLLEGQDESCYIEFSEYLISAFGFVKLESLNRADDLEYFINHGPLFDSAFITDFRPKSNMLGGGLIKRLKSLGIEHIVRGHTDSINFYCEKDEIPFMIDVNPRIGRAIKPAMYIIGADYGLIHTLTLNIQNHIDGNLLSSVTRAINREIFKKNYPVLVGQSYAIKDQSNQNGIIPIAVVKVMDASNNIHFAPLSSLVTTNMAINADYVKEHQLHISDAEQVILPLCCTQGFRILLGDSLFFTLLAGKGLFNSSTSALPGKSISLNASQRPELEQYIVNLSSNIVNVKYVGKTDDGSIFKLEWQLTFDLNLLHNKLKETPSYEFAGMCISDAKLIQFSWYIPEKTQNSLIPKYNKLVTNTFKQMNYAFKIFEQSNDEEKTEDHSNM